MKKLRKLYLLLLLLLMSMLLSACGAEKTGEKIAVLEWKKAVEGHPAQTKLQQEEKQLKLLVEKRKQQEKLALAQLSSLNKLRGLKDMSERSYLAADFNTHMAEKQAIEQGKLIGYAKKLDGEGDGLIAARRKQIEEAHQLEMFNLKLQLDTVKLKAEDRAIIEQKLEAAKVKRDQELSLLEAEKQAYINSKLKPYVEAMQGRLAEAAQQKNQESLAKLESSGEKYDSMLAAAPKALQNALQIMDREIDKQQAKCDALKKQIGQDIESQVIRLAKERGYTIVFNTFKVNVKAEDITGDVINALKKQN